MSFADQIITWYEQNPRPLPWKSSNDPYKIWLSEIILQQTRVEQGIPYYLKFVKRFSTVQELAVASLDEVLKLWEGLGYYSRARNMHSAAQTIVANFGGQFPKTYEEILSLKGVGLYTAAAVASFAYRLPYAVVDGNVIRVISRYFGVTKAVDDSTTLKEIRGKTQSLLSKDHPDKFNQAIMNLGATICTPKQPKCVQCPLQESCFSLSNDLINQIPLKLKKLKRKTRYFHYLIISENLNILLDQRTQQDIWKGLYQFPLMEKDDENILNKNEISAFIAEHTSINKFTIKSDTRTTKQLLTHQSIVATFYHITLQNTICSAPNLIKASRSKLLEYAFPKTIRDYIEDHLI